MRYGKGALVAGALALASLAGTGPVLEAYASTSAKGPSVRQVPSVGAKSSLQTLLIAGLDGDPESRDADRRSDNHTDALILLTSRPGSGEVQALHIPRDTKVWTRLGETKINGVWRQGGSPALLHAVTGLTGLPVDNLITIDFARFRRVMQVMGRFPFYVDRTIVSPEGDVRVQPGLRRLTPRQALAVVRFRHEALGDIGRVHRQERFVRTAVMQASKLPYQAFATLLRLADPQVTQKATLEAYTLVHPLRKYTAHSIPGTFSTGPGASYWLADHAGVQALSHVLRGDQAASTALAVWSRGHSTLDVDDGRDRSL
ncbi:MAG: LCP family protein [Firmicutes bacterium]|nr:LCP family protein [Bacillota bacterium]